ncbi:MAG: thiamine-phosphate synthase family protein [Thermoplasmata archaeon]|jgi:predicted fused transcriptional regulator/phosphomethylpyrimidine kinase/predicted transcriptional regulator|nr:hypothetical protein [Thermoplasmatales archaeon]
MYPPCVEVNRYLIPETRKRVAKNLKSRGMKENEIARLLHVSQGMVSRYLKEKESLFLSGEIEKFSRELSNRIVENYGEVENLEFFCRFCISIREKRKLCDLHKIENCSLCTYLYNPFRKREEDEISGSLRKALKSLENLNISDFMPEVRMNIAYSRENPGSRMDVMAFPGRLTYISGRLVGFSDPEFGASKHLSSILLNLRDRGVRAIMNLKFKENLITKLRKSNFTFCIMDREKYGSIEDFVKDLEGSYDAIVDPGTFGIEPMIYILGRDPESLVEKVKKLLEVN